MWMRGRRAVLWATLSTGAVGGGCDSTLDPVGAIAQGDARPSLEAASQDETVSRDAQTVPGLVGWWALDSNPNDSVGNNHGALLGGASFVKDAERGDVLVCNGTDAAVQVANTLSLSFTYAAWLFSDTPSSQGRSAIEGDPLIWSNEPAVIDDFALAVLNDRLAYINYNETSTGTASVTDGKWHHVAASRQDGERVALYVDGRVDGDGNSGSGVVSANPNVYFCGLPGGRHFKGLLDDVRLYDRVLTPMEVESLFIATRY
jgi:hypothetical protein